MSRFTKKEIDDQKVRISKSIYAVAPWLYDYALWVNRRGFFDGYYYNPICSNNHGRPMSPDEFKRNLLIMIGIICDCSERLEDLDYQNDLVLSVCLHNQLGLSRLFFKMLDIDLGLTTEEITYSDYMGTLSLQQKLSGADFPYVDAYNNINVIFRNSHVIDELCRLHEEAVSDMTKRNHSVYTGGYNIGMFKMCLVYDLVRRMLLTMQVSRYTERELALLNINVSKCTRYLLSTEANRDEVNFMFESNIRKISKLNKAQFLTSIMILRALDEAKARRY